MRILGAYGGIEDQGDYALDVTGHDDIGESNALADEESTSGEMFVEGGCGALTGFRQCCVELKKEIWVNGECVA